MKYRFLAVAETDLKDLVQWYELKLPGLGNRFLDDFAASIEQIKRSPEAWRQIGKGIRRIMLRVFKAGIIYKLEDDEIVIIAVIDLRSDPVNWKTTLKRRT